MFYFEPLLNQVLAGIDGTSILRGVTDIAFAILLIGFLTGLYSAAMRGGDLRALGVATIKYLVVGIIIANWASVFRDVNGAFTSVGHLIANGSGAGDMFASWLDQLKQQYANTGNQSLLDLILAAPAALINAILILVAYLIYPLAVFLFSFLNSMYGAILYVIGPLVLALIPMTGVGQMGRTFAANLMAWNAWAILYGTFGALMTAIHVNDAQTLLNSQGVLGWLRGLPDALLLGLVSIVFAICIALIPFIANKLISGDVGSAAGSVVQAATLALATGAAAATGLVSGFGSASAAGSGAGGVAGASAATATSSSAPTAPPAPSMASSIRSAVASALSGGSSPTTPSSTAGSGGSGTGVALSAAGKGAASSGVPYRPSGTVPSLVYHAARAAGSAVRQARKA